MLTKVPETTPKIRKAPFHGVEVSGDTKNSHRLTYTLGEKERLRIFANLLIDMFIESNKYEKVKALA